MFSSQSSEFARPCARTVVILKSQATTRYTVSRRYSERCARQPTETPPERHSIACSIRRIWYVNGIFRPVAGFK